ncbi:MAG: hypothetical protein ABEJ42_00220 [Halobacteriaceae archaeon]
MPTGEYERIRSVVADASPEQPLTAREVLDLLEEHDSDVAEEVGSPHHIATVLGRRARHGDVEVLDGDPYRYRLVDD